MKTILYCRVSTSDQILDHQVTQARTAGFAIDEVISDNGVSGVSTRLAERDQGKRLFDLLRRGDVLVVRWIDRLGRNYADVTEVIRQFMKRGIVVRTVINGLVFDGATKEPMQMAVRDALISFMAALSQAQAEATKEAQRAGIEHAKARDDAYRGRKPSFTRKQLDQVRDMLRIGTSISTIAKTAGLSRQAIYRLKDNPAWAEGVLATWAAWRSVGGLAFVCSTSPVRRSTPRALRHLRRLRAVRTRNDA
jgi:putative DNA-invertase from lambdoid prophage Rac